MKNKNENKKINENLKRDFRFEVANLITEARYHYKLTQAQLAKKVGTQQPSIARIESGSTLPSLSFLERLADSIGTYLVAPKFGFMAQGDTFKEKGSEYIFYREGEIVIPYTGSVLTPYYNKVSSSA